MENCAAAGWILSGRGDDDGLMRTIKKKGGHGLQIGIAQPPFDKYEQDLYEEAYLRQKSEYTRSKRQLKFSFLANENFGAFAYISPNTKNAYDFIGINFGTVITLHDTFCRMLSCPNLFPECGDPKKETDNPDIIIPYITGNVFGQLGKGTRKLLRPKCPIRYNYAKYLTYHALLFLFFHELAHLTRGHLELIQLLGGKNYISEDIPHEQNRIEQKDKSPKWTLFMLEWDADNQSIQKIFGGLFDNMEEFTKNDSSSLGMQEIAISKYTFGDIPSCIRTAIVTFYTIFRIQDRNFVNYAVLDELSHPPAPIRQLSSLQHMQALIKAIYPEFTGNFYNLAGDTIIQCEIAFARMLGEEKTDTRGFLSAQSQQFQQQKFIENMYEEFEKYQGTLNKYRRFKEPIK